ncbi:hypothetical protein FJZ17_04200, partial [Candidatus Pacearchaeota archaeon]|nr:hypothetical protein [Candidatus Pacearchaeota archaeon]
MKKEEDIKLILGIIFLVAFLNIASASNSAIEEKGNYNSNSKISSSVLKSLEDKDKTMVLLEIKQVTNSKTIAFDEKQNLVNQIGADSIKNDFGSVITAKLSKQEIIELSQNEAILKIAPIPTRNIFLQNSGPLVNATLSWSLKESGLNLTGQGQTICIIDTGVNYSHTDLGGGYGNNTNMNYKIIGGWDYCADNVDCSTEDSDPIDVNGHGTHVAGIAGANNSIRGVATGAKIIMMKACNSSGTCFDSAIRNGIDWCVENSSIFNITIISMSLGGGSYSNYCDYQDDRLNLTLGINNAVAKNISVVVSTGNTNSAINIASPACVRNATPVTSVSKSDVLSSYNRNFLVKLAAPGESINSTKIDGTYIAYDGTSMATPHAAGAIAILNQYLAATGRSKTPSQIEDLFVGTGKNITDSQNTSQNFSRINIYNALLNLDTYAPNVSLISPLDNSLFNSSISFSCNASDLSLKNVTFYLWNSTGVYNQTTSTISGGFNFFQINITNILPGHYNWNCKYSDESGNTAFAVSNRTISNRKQVILIGVDGLNNERFLSLLNAGNLTNFSRLIAGVGWNTIANITGHTTTQTAPGNAELMTGLNQTLNGVDDNGAGKIVPDNATIWERLENFDSNIITGFVYGKYRAAYIPNSTFNNALADINWYVYNKNSTYTYNTTNWKYGGFTATTIAYSENVSNKAIEFINTYANNSFFLVVYFGVPDAAGHNDTDNSEIYNASVMNVDYGLGILLDNLEANGLRGASNVTQIIITADHGWNNGTTNHNTATGSIILPLITNNKSLIFNSSTDGIREQCDVTPTILDYFSVPVSNYTDITGNGCSSMLGDLVAPRITINNPSTSLSSTSVSLGVTLSEVGSCLYSLNSGANSSMSSSDNLTFTTSVTGVEGSNSVVYSCNDTLGNSNSSSRSFNIDTSTPSSGGGGGGGGGGGTTTTSILSNDEFSLGTSKEMAIGSEVKFISSSSTHSLKINKLSISYANLTLQSSPINFLIFVGEETKKDLNNDSILDIYLRLNSITNNRANLTIKSINEPLGSNIPDNNSLLTDESTSSSDKGLLSSPGRLWQKLYIPLIILVIVILVIIYYVENKKLHRVFERNA